MTLQLWFDDRYKLIGDNNEMRTYLIENCELNNKKITDELASQMIFENARRTRHIVVDDAEFYYEMYPDDIKRTYKNFPNIPEIRKAYMMEGFGERWVHISIYPGHDTLVLNYEEIKELRDYLNNMIGYMRKIKEQEGKKK